jgi:hypothetical protein
MAIKLEEIETMLEKIGVKDVKSLPDRAELAYGVSGVNKFVHLVRLYENGELFQMYAINLVESEQVRKSPHRPIIADYLLKQAYDLKFGSAEMDDDGEIRIGVEVPLEDNTLTVKQFTRIFSLLANDVDSILTDIKRILETGSLPKPDLDLDLNETVREMVARKPDLARQMLEDPNIRDEVKALIHLHLGHGGESESNRIQQISAALKRGDLAEAQRLAGGGIPDSI